MQFIADKEKKRYDEITKGPVCNETQCSWQIH